MTAVVTIVVWCAQAARHQALGMSCATQVEEWSHDQDQGSQAAMLEVGPGQPSSGTWRRSGDEIVNVAPLTLTLTHTCRHSKV